MNVDFKLSIYLVCTIILIFSNNLFAQTVSEQHLEFEIRSYSSSQDHLPFWIWANQKGMVGQQEQYHHFCLLKYEGFISDTVHKLKLNYGVSLVSDLAT